MRHRVLVVAAPKAFLLAIVLLMQPFTAGAADLPTDYFGEEAIDVRWHRVAAVRQLQRLHKLAGPNPPQSDRTFKTYDSLRLFDILPSSASIPGLVRADPKRGKEKEAVDYVLRRKLEALVTTDDFLRNGTIEGLTRYPLIAIRTRPAAATKLMNELRSSGLFAFVAREVDGRGGGAGPPVFYVPEAAVFSGVPTHNEAKKFITAVVSEAYPTVKGYITSVVRYGGGFCYSFDVTGRGDTLFSRDPNYWDKANVNLCISKGLLGPAGTVEILVTVKPAKTKGPSGIVPPPARFKPFEDNDFGVAESIARQLIGGRDWEMR
jgi:hypothetical protein